MERAFLMTVRGTHEIKPNCANTFKASAHIVSTSISLAKASCMTKFTMDEVVKYTPPAEGRCKITWPKNSEELRVSIASKEIYLLFSGNFLEIIQ